MPKKTKKKQQQEYKSNFVAILRRLKGCCSFTSTLNYNNNNNWRLSFALGSLGSKTFPSQALKLNLSAKCFKKVTSHTTKGKRGLKGQAGGGEWQWQWQVAVEVGVAALCRCRQQAKN